jgi:hypothetical protein
MRIKTSWVRCGKTCPDALMLRTITQHELDYHREAGKDVSDYHFQQTILLQHSALPFAQVVRSAHQRQANLWRNEANGV